MREKNLFVLIAISASFAQAASVLFKRNKELNPKIPAVAAYMELQLKISNFIN